MKKFSKYKHWIIIVAVSLPFSLLFTLAREHRILAHVVWINRFVEYFGYGLRAFLFSLPLFFIGFLVLYYIVRACKRSRKWKIAIGVIIILILLSPFYSHPVAFLNQEIPPLQPSLDDKTFVVFTFDTEEDWDPHTHCYYDSYKYITSRAFYQLVDGLDERDVSATFYVTPNLARDMPEVLKYLENRGQTIGVHLHPHGLVDVAYPYAPPYAQSKEDEIANYDYSDKQDFMKRAKDEIEGTIGHEVLLYRSGKLSCDYQVEKIAADLGYKAISNHRGIYFIDPLDIWNLGEATCDCLDAERFDSLDRYMTLFRLRAEHEKIITFMGHPMRLYNLEQNQIDERTIGRFLEFVDDLSKDPGVESVNQYQLLELVQK